MIFYILLGFAPTLGFCLLFNVPKKDIIPATIIGGLAWSLSQILIYSGSGKVAACFLGACLVGLLSDTSARILKQASTIYIIPGIMPLVPGSGMYFTMVHLIDGRYSEATAVGTETLFIAGSIALALLIVGSIIRIVVSIKRKILNIT